MFTYELATMHARTQECFYFEISIDYNLLGMQKAHFSPIVSLMIDRGEMKSSVPPWRLTGAPSSYLTRPYRIVEIHPAPHLHLLLGWKSFTIGATTNDYNS